MGPEHLEFWRPPLGRSDKASLSTLLRASGLGFIRLRGVVQGFF